MDDNDFFAVGDRITTTEPTECVCCERTVKPHMVMYRIENEAPVPTDLYCSPCWFETVDEEDVERCTLTDVNYGEYLFYYDANTHSLRNLRLEP
jgi:S-adenosylmethionine synthetase